MFANSNVFVYKPNDSFQDLLLDVQKQLDEDAKHSIVGSVDVIRELRAKGKPGSAIEIPVVFTSMVSSAFDSASLSSSWNVSHVLNSTPQVCLDCQALELNGTLEIRWYVSDSLINGNQIQILLSNYVEALTLFAKCGISDMSSHEQYPVSIDREKIIGKWTTQASHILTDIQTSYAIARSGLVSASLPSHVLYQIDFQKFDRIRFEQALTDIIASHTALSSVISSDGHQYQGKPSRFELSEHTSVSSKTEFEEYCQTVAIEFHSEAIPLDLSCYIQARVVSYGDEMTRVFLKIDFLVADGRSINLIISDLLGIYHGLKGYPFFSPSSYESYLQACLKHQLSPVEIVSETYWRHKFQSIPSGPSRIVNSEQMVHASKPLTSTVPNLVALSSAAKLIGVSLDALIIHAYSLAIRYWNQEEPFSIVVPSWNRHKVVEDVNSIIGDFTQLAWVEFNMIDEDLITQLKRIDLTLKLDQYYSRFTSGIKALRRHSNIRFPAVYTSILDTPEYLLHQRFGEITDVSSRIVEATSNTANVAIDCVSKKKSEHELILQWDIKITDFELTSELFSQFIDRVVQLPSQIQLAKDFKLSQPSVEIELIKIEKEMQINGKN